MPKSHKSVFQTIFSRIRLPQKHRPDATRCDTVCVNQLRDAIHQQSVHAQGNFLAYLAILIYFFVAVTSTTHEDLLRETAKAVPLLNIQLPLWWFFLAGPLALTVIHLNLLRQYYYLSINLKRLDAALCQKYGNGKKGKECYERDLHANFLLTTLFLDRDMPTGLRFISHIALWAISVVAPLVLLCLFQWYFLAYHDPKVTWIQRGALCFDAFTMLYLWYNIFDNSYRRWLALSLEFGSMGLLIITVGLINFQLTLPDETRYIEKSLQSFIPKDSEKPEKGNDSIPSWASYYDRLPSVPRNLDIQNRLLLKKEIPADLFTGENLSQEQYNERVADYAKKHQLGLNLNKRKLEEANLNNSQLIVASLEKANLKGAYLTGANLKGADLAKANLEKANLEPTNFLETVLRIPDIEGKATWWGNLEDSGLKNVHLEGADLSGANLKDARLGWADLKGANLTGAKLERTDLKGVKLDGANLMGADINNVDLTGADLKGANLTEAKLVGVNFIEADLEGVDLTKANLEDVDLTETNFKGADLTGANLEGANLGWANLHCVDSEILRREARNGTDLAILIETNLNGADLTGASLNGADLTGANLNGADLTEAALEGARFGRADLDDVDLEVLREADLDGVDLTILREASLNGADLTGANLNGADLAGANFRGCNMTGANLRGARLPASFKLVDLRDTNFGPLSQNEWEKGIQSLAKDLPENLKKSFEYQEYMGESPTTSVVLTDCLIDEKQIQALGWKGQSLTPTQFAPKYIQALIDTACNNKKVGINTTSIANSARLWLYCSESPQIKLQGLRLLDKAQCPDGTTPFPNHLQKKIKEQLAELEKQQAPSPPN
ncbi:pentapeptide repeat-containing protein [Desulfovibrio inopinatus]|uniref:pentapeptide repeat-containing protein n=1 Tax=Desulfovibrio inopinatus TaxID=102109 RepID=UPI0006843535|nr:pentapeptide repeat-containing protein [Desulfovibrio inopinatus]